MADYRIDCINKPDRNSRHEHARTPGFEPFPNIFCGKTTFVLTRQKADNAVLTLIERACSPSPAEDASSQPGCSARFRQTTITL
jgi:hypothetical protein